MSDAASRKRETLSMKIPAEVDALRASDDSRAAVQTFKAEEAQLHDQLLTSEITPHEHFAQWTALWKRTPRAVRLAPLNITQTITEARRRDSSL
jgi:hypothetical protein